MNETWKDVPSLPGVEASTLGRVRIKAYLQRMPRGGVKRVEGKPTFGCWDGKRFVYLFKRKTFKVHFAVCETFNGLRPFPKAVVMHDDESSSNNAPDNLKWGTQKQNLNYPGFIEYCKRRGTKSKSSEFFEPIPNSRIENTPNTNVGR